MTVVTFVHTEHINVLQMGQEGIFSVLGARHVWPSPDISDPHVPFILLLHAAPAVRFVSRLAICFLDFTKPWLFGKEA